MNINSDEELDVVLKELGLTKYVKYNESFKNLHDRYPFFRTFIIVVNNNETYSSEKINKYIGYDFVEHREEITALLVNKILNELNKKGYKIMSEEDVKISLEIDKDSLRSALNIMSFILCNTSKGSQDVYYKLKDRNYSQAELDSLDDFYKELNNANEDDED